MLTYNIYGYILISSRGANKGENKMTKAEQRAIKAREKDLIVQGIDKEIAKVMAKVEFETGLIKVIVNGN